MLCTCRCNNTRTFGHMDSCKTVFNKTLIIILSDMHQWHTFLHKIIFTISAKLYGYSASMYYNLRIYYNVHI